MNLLAPVWKMRLPSMPSTITTLRWPSTGISRRSPSFWWALKVTKLFLFTLQCLSRALQYQNYNFLLTEERFRYKSKSLNNGIKFTEVSPILETLFCTRWSRSVFTEFDFETFNIIKTAISKIHT